jgi:DNA-binding response OmpR family regulator
MLGFAPNHDSSRRSPAGLPVVCVVDPAREDYQAWRQWAAADEVQLEFTATAEEALRRARCGRVDLWVINAQLPGMSGAELCGMLKSQSRQAVVCLVTDGYSAQSERAAWAARATMFQCKPLPQAHLETCLAHLRDKLPVGVKLSTCQ